MSLLLIKPAVNYCLIDFISQVSFKFFLFLINSYYKIILGYNNK